MPEAALPLAATVLAWWIGTGAVLWLCRLPDSAHRWLGPAVAAAAGGAFYGLWLSSAGEGVASAYAGFLCALALWGCLETSYYCGWLTGPRHAPCPPQAGEAQRFLLAIQTSLHHELAVAGVGALLFLVAGGAPNTVGMWTYLILWWMRWSAKLNLFLGVPNQYEAFLPERMRYLCSYMVRRRFNLLFPISVTVPAVAAGALLEQASAASSESGAQAAGAALLAALLLLAVLEHWFLVLPLPDHVIWKWALPRARGPAQRNP